jgi:hypothetical protein
LEVTILLCDDCEQNLEKEKTNRFFRELERTSLVLTSSRSVRDLRGIDDDADDGAVRHDIDF